MTTNTIPCHFTKDRPPTEADSHYSYILAFDGSMWVTRSAKYVRENSGLYPAWMPMPPPPKSAAEIAEDEACAVYCDKKGLTWDDDEAQSFCDGFRAALKWKEGK